jgi:type I restriction enzyme, S subunit
MVITAQNINQKPGYKQTEVGVIPEDWELVKIGDYAYVTKLAGFEYTNYFDYRKSGPIIAIRALNIKDGKLDLSDIHTLPKQTSKLLPRSQLDKGDLVISYVGTLGRVAVIPEDGKFHLAPNVAKIRTNLAQVDPFYLSQSLNGEIGQQAIFKVAASTTQAALSMHNLREVTFVLPPLPEQHAIATALSDVDALIESLDKLIAKKRDIKQATMQQLLTGKTRLPGFSGEWDVKKLGEIAEIGMGRTPSRRNQTYWGRGYKWLSIADLKCKYVFETKEEITALAASDMTVIPKGTLVMSFKLTIGKVAFTGCDMHSNEAICSFTKLRANAEYLYYILSQTDFSLYGKQAVKGYTLNTDSLNSVEILYPNISEQQAIATILSDMDAEIAALERRRDKTRALKQGMMQELLTGKTRLL